MRRGTEERITLKSQSDIACMQAAGRVVEETLALLGRAVRSGITTDELDEIAHDCIVKAGAVPSFLHYQGYPKSICASVNAEVVHGIPGKYRLKDGDIVSCDVGAFLEGFHGDAARTFLVGDVAEETRRLVEVTKACFFVGLKYARVGYRISDISLAVQRHAEGNGYSVVREMIGHGVGRKLHEPPDVPNYWDSFLFSGRGERLAAGMAIAIEPMINLGRREVVQRSNGWTIEAADGKPSAHYENTVIITDGEPLLTTLHEGA